MYVTVPNPTELHRCVFSTEHAGLLLFSTVLLLHGCCLDIKGKLKLWWLCLEGLVTCSLRFDLAAKSECGEVNHIVGETQNLLHITLSSSRNKNVAYGT